MTRQKKGFYLTLVAQLALILIYLAAFVFHWTGNPKQMALGFMLTLMPLLYFLPGVWRRQGKPYAALALLAPLHLFFGGVIWLWGYPLWGIPISFCFPANRNHHAQLRRLAPRRTKSRARREKIPLIFRTARL